MAEGLFWFIMGLLGLAFVVVLTEWWLARANPQEEIRRESHRKLMEEIRRHKDDC